MKNRNMTRREFLKIAGVGVSAAALAASGAGCAAQNDQDPAVEIETPSYAYGDSTAAKGRVLVGYATRTGSTVGVASTIGETLAAQGYAVDVKPIKENPAVENYQAVVLGSAVNGGQWLPEAVRYVEEHQKELGRLPVRLFCVHIMNLEDDEASRKNRLAYLDNVRGMVQPADEAYFAGMGMNPENTPGLVRWVYRTFAIGPEGDCRDWDKIRGWAKTISV